MQPEQIEITTTIHAPLAKVWDYYNSPAHIVKWNQASSDWHTVSAVNDLTVGGTFNYRMEAKDSSEGFDFGGVYDQVEQHKLIAYTMTDGRQVQIEFDGHGDHSHISVSFDPESENPAEFQREGWQSILDNFVRYVESN